VSSFLLSQAPVLKSQPLKYVPMEALYWCKVTQKADSMMGKLERKRRRERERAEIMSRISSYFLS
jgi:hypothetical protein